MLIRSVITRLDLSKNETRKAHQGFCFVPKSHLGGIFSKIEHLETNSESSHFSKVLLINARHHELPINRFKGTAVNKTNTARSVEVCGGLSAPGAPGTAAPQGHPLAGSSSPHL